MSFFKGLAKGFTDFGHGITNMINLVLLGIVYFIGVGLTSITAKIVGKHFLNIKNNIDKQTYWEDCNVGTEEKETYYRQF